MTVTYGNLEFLTSTKLNASMAEEIGIRAAADTAETTARVAGDTAEATARTAADTAEATARTAADTAEATARAAGDTAEATARIAGDAASAGLVTAEATARAAADTAFAALFASSLVSAGYQKLPSGLILEWGNATTSGGGGVTVTYPIVFPSGVFSVQATAVNAGAAPTTILATTGVSAANFGCASSDSATHAFTPGTSFYWLAVGH